MESNGFYEVPKVPTDDWLHAKKHGLHPVVVINTTHASDRDRLDKPMTAYVAHLPRIGETIALDEDEYYEVVNVVHNVQTEPGVHAYYLVPAVIVNRIRIDDLNKSE